MNEFVKAVPDILVAVLPAGNLGVVLTVLALVFLVLVVTNLFKLKWIGLGTMQIYRWLRCQIRNRHDHHLDGSGWTDLNTGRSRGTNGCSVCSKVLVERQ